jgi:hypothetical protein
MKTKQNTTENIATNLHKSAANDNKITASQMRKNVIDAAQRFHVAGPTRDKRALRVEDQEGHIAALVPIPEMIPNGEETAKIVANLTSAAANLYSICDAIQKWNDRQDGEHALSKRLSRRLNAVLHTALTG